jgi:type IV pilus assembly protein PilW
LSLIELLVAMAIGLVVTLAITTVLIDSQGLQRTSTALNDVSQTGAHATLALDRAARSSGSGFTQFRSAMGCVLNAAITTPALKVLLPVAADLPAPFANIGPTSGLKNVVLAPVVIIDGGGANGSDQLVVMAGNHAHSETPRLIDAGSATTTSVTVGNALGMRASDLVLVADSVAGSGCMIQQIAAPVSQQQLPMSGAYYKAVGTTRSLDSFSGTSAVVPLGWMSNVVGTPSNPPSFTVFGLDDKNRLRSYDLLNTTDSDVAIAAENVFSVHALYGVGGAPLVWTAPTAGTTYGVDKLWGATTTADKLAVQAAIQNIRAVRVAMVLQSPVQEQQTTPPVSPDTLVLFPDLPVANQVTITLTSAQQNYRYRIVETIIPLLNL